MQFPPDYVLDSDRLLYTAHYTKPFDPSAHQCGLLLDEWTEVIPGTTHDTGITFNFDRPEQRAAAGHPPRDAGHRRAGAGSGTTSSAR